MEGDGTAPSGGPALGGVRGKRVCLEVRGFSRYQLRVGVSTPENNFPSLGCLKRRKRFRPHVRGCGQREKRQTVDVDRDGRAGLHAGAMGMHSRPPGLPRSWPARGLTLHPGTQALVSCLPGTAPLGTGFGLPQEQGKQGLLDWEGLTTEWQVTGVRV